MRRKQLSAPSRHDPSIQFKKGKIFLDPPDTGNVNLIPSLARRLSDRGLAVHLRLVGQGDSLEAPVSFLGAIRILSVLFVFSTVIVGGAASAQIEKTQDMPADKWQEIIDLYHYAISAPVDVRTRTYTEIRGKLDQIVAEFPASDLAVHILLQDTVDGINIANLRQDLSLGNDGAIFPEATAQANSQFERIRQALEQTVTPTMMSKAAVKATTEKILELAYFEEFDGLFLSKLNIEGTDLLAWIAQNPKTALGSAALSVGEELAADIILEISAEVLANALFSAQPLSELPENWKVPTRATLKAAITEFGSVALSGGNPAAAVSGVVERIFDVVEIYNASKKLNTVQDQGLIAIATGLELTTQMLVSFPSERSSTIARQMLASTRENLPDIVGKDDEAAVWEIVNLSIVGLMAHKRNNPKKAQLLVTQIREQGQLGENVNFLSPVLRPVDWLTWLSGGRFQDAPARAAYLIISGTSLRDVDNKSPVPVSTTPVLPALPRPGAQWYQAVVPEGTIGGGYSHGEFLIAQQTTHLGSDIGGGCGLDVLAADDGEVTKIVKDGDTDFGVPGQSGVGNAVVIRHGDAGGKPVYTLYLHMAGTPLVSLGPVQKGQRLGVTGATGFSLGCHLHFEVRHFEGIRGIYNDEWQNIYGSGDKRKDPNFLAMWSDPETWLRAIQEEKALTQPIVTAGAAFAEQQGRWTASIVPAPGIEIGYRPCGNRTDLRACLSEKGLEPEAIDFAMAVTDDQGGTFAIKFRELGAVDLATAEFIGADIHHYPVLLNGPLDIHPVDGSYPLKTIFIDELSRKMLALFPQASSSRSQVRAYRTLQDGTQRFVLVESVTNQCRVCAILGSAITFLEIGPSTGNKLRRRPIGLLLEDPATVTEMTAGILKSRPQILQATLNSLGYEAGPMDGFPGPKTRTALMTFQAEQCLPPTGQPNSATVAALLAADGFISPCAGAKLPAGISANSPLRPGMYVDNSAYCQLAILPDDIEFESQRILRPGGLTFGHEGGCSTRRTDILDGVTLFRGSCSEENQTTKMQWMFDVQSPESFVELAVGSRTGIRRLYTMCAQDSPLRRSYSAWFDARSPEPLQTVRSNFNFRVEQSNDVIRFVFPKESIENLIQSSPNGDLSGAMFSVTTDNNLEFVCQHFISSAQPELGIFGMQKLLSRLDCAVWQSDGLSSGRVPGQVFLNYDKLSSQLVMESKSSAISPLAYGDTPRQFLFKIGFPTIDQVVVQKVNLGEISSEISVGGSTTTLGEAGVAAKDEVIQNLADYLEAGGSGAIANLRKGVRLAFRPTKAAFLAGKIVMSNSVTPTSAIEAVNNLNQSFSWQGWMDVTQGNNPMARKIYVECKFDPDDSGLSPATFNVVNARLLQYQNQRAVFACSTH